MLFVFDKPSEEYKCPYMGKFVEDLVAGEEPVLCDDGEYAFRIPFDDKYRHGARLYADLHNISHYYAYETYEDISALIHLAAFLLDIDNPRIEPSLTRLVHIIADGSHDEPIYIDNFPIVQRLHKLKGDRWIIRMARAGIVDVAAVRILSIADLTPVELELFPELESVVIGRNVFSIHMPMPRLTSMTVVDQIQPFKFLNSQIQSTLEEFIALDDSKPHRFTISQLIRNGKLKKLHLAHCPIDADCVALGRSETIDDLKICNEIAYHGVLVLPPVRYLSMRIDAAKTILDMRRCTDTLVSLNLAYKMSYHPQDSLRFMNLCRSHMERMAALPYLVELDIGTPMTQNHSGTCSRGVTIHLSILSQFVKLKKLRSHGIAIDVDLGAPGATISTSHVRLTHYTSTGEWGVSVFLRTVICSELTSLDLKNLSGLSIGRDDFPASLTELNIYNTSPTSLATEITHLKYIKTLTIGRSGPSTERSSIYVLDRNTAYYGTIEKLMCWGNSTIMLDECPGIKECAIENSIVHSLQGCLSNLESLELVNVEGEAMYDLRGAVSLRRLVCPNLNICAWPIAKMTYIDVSSGDLLELLHPETVETLIADETTIADVNPARFIRLNECYINTKPQVSKISKKNETHTRQYTNALPFGNELSSVTVIR